MTQRRSRIMIALLAVLGSTSAAAQPRPLNQTMLKRIAEAVDGLRSDSAVWVVVDAEAPNPVAGIFTREDLANRLVQELGRSFFVSGPYLSDRVNNRPADCVHLYSSLMRGVPPRPTPGPGPSPVALVRGPAYCPDPGRPPRRIFLEFEANDGTRSRFELPGGADALFLTESAIEKFVLPYYLRIIGLDQTKALRDAMLTRGP